MHEQIYSLSENKSFNRYFDKRICTKNKNAKRIEVVEEITDEIIDCCGGAVNNLGTGGMITKIRAGQIAFENNFDMVILSSKNPDDLYSLFDGENKGTLFKVR